MLAVQWWGALRFCACRECRSHPYQAALQGSVILSKLSVATQGVAQSVGLLVRVPIVACYI